MTENGKRVFGLWRIRFPPVLVRTGRRLPVQALGERGVWVTVTGYPKLLLVTKLKGKARPRLSGGLLCMYVPRPGSVSNESGTRVQFTS